MELRENEKLEEIYCF